MQELISLMNYSFMQRALICGIAISFCAALIGVILVLKNYSMIGHGLGEVAFAALSLAMCLGLPELAVSIPIVIIAAIIIMIISQKKGESGVENRIKNELRQQRRQRVEVTFPVAIAT